MHFHCFIWNALITYCKVQVTVITFVFACIVQCQICVLTVLISLPVKTFFCLFFPSFPPFLCSFPFSFLGNYINTGMVWPRVDSSNSNVFFSSIYIGPFSCNRQNPHIFGRLLVSPRSAVLRNIKKCLSTQTLQILRNPTFSQHITTDHCSGRVSFIIRRIIY